MLRYLSLAIALQILFVEQGESARILGVFPFPGRSHFISFAPLLEELAKRGHEVSVITAFSRKSPLKNYKDITIRNYLNQKDAPVVNMFERHETNVLLNMAFFRFLSVGFCEEFLNEPAIQTLIHSEQEFDLIIYEPFFTECAYGIIHKLNAPFMQISSNTIAKWMGDGVGNPFFYSYNPDILLEYTDEMSFTERLVNTLVITFLHLERDWITIPRMNSLLRKYFNDTQFPTVWEIENKSSFLLLNSHTSLNYPRPLTPNAVEVGGMHLKEPQKLPKHLQKLLDGSPDGVIYFSLGSNVRSIDMPDEIRQHFLAAFSKLKQKVLWKWENDTLPGQPLNVHLSKWFPQNDILAHPNVKAFITHGGLLSTQEAVNFGVPLIAIPFMADQKMNARRAVSQGYGVTVAVTNVTEKSLDWALSEILTDKRYRENARRLSNLFRDQPEKPLDRAVFWTEYVIRHKGALHMRSAALKLNFFEYYLLDVIVVLLLAAFVFLAVSITILKMLCRRIFSKEQDRTIQQRQHLLTTMLRYLLLAIVLPALFVEQGESARILGLLPFPGKSHFISFAPLFEELAKRGHEVSVISAFPRKSPLKNYKDLTIKNYLDLGDAQAFNMFETHEKNILVTMTVFRNLFVGFCEEFLNEPVIQTLIHNEQEFDLIIYEPFYTECAYGVIHKLNVPFMHISSNTIAKWMGDGVGNPFFYSYNPDLLLGYTDEMSFTERLVNTLVITYLHLERDWITIPRMHSLMKRYLNDTNIPSVWEIENKSSFLLLNSHTSLNYPRPLTPNTVEVGGMHLKEPQKLPKDLQKLLDGATDGVIYFSLGSNVRSIDMPDEIRQHFLAAFSKLKQKVLWKWEKDTLPGQPSNVHLSKWFPQNDILAHPNVKAFITHGGLLSTQEAVNFGVPLIAIPFMADQKMNALRAVSQGYGVTVAVTNVTEKSLDWALSEILTDKRYRENAQRLSNLFRDQPQKPLDRAVFWTEYVIRHKGALHMRSAALKLNFFQYYLLDVIVVLLLAAFVFLAVSLIILKMLCRRIFSKTKPVDSKLSRKKKN